MRVAIIGGTGRLGSALAWRLGSAGYDVVIGSRDAPRACAAAGWIGAMVGSGAAVEGARNPDAVAGADVVLISVPAAGHASVLAQVAAPLAGKVVIDTCVCHDGRDAGAWLRPAEGSAAARVRRLAPRTATVAATLHTIPERSLRHPHRHPPGDALVVGEGRSAVEAAGTILSALGLRWWEVGDLAAAAALEQLACLLARLADRHGAPAPGLRVHGLPEPGAPAAHPALHGQRVGV